MNQKNQLKRVFSALILFAIIGSFGWGPLTVPGQVAKAEAEAAPAGGQPSAVSVAGSLYLPQVVRDSSWVSPFGVESIGRLQEGGTVYNQVKTLGVRWVRMNQRISWRLLQPSPGDPINWSLLVDFENELRAIKAAGLTPIVVVDDYPEWATYILPGGKPSTCGPLLEQHFAAFGGFLAQLVSRYKVYEYGVHHWELGNEPDIDPDLLKEMTNIQMGCWGNINDPNYGGAVYGRMLKVVAPVVRAADPDAKIWVGGLLLNAPDEPDPAKGNPQNFLRGILAAGAGPYFDVLPYHSYVGYNNEVVDQDNGRTESPWYSWGGATVGKARFLRQVMAEFGVNKPLFVNEIGLMSYATSTPAPSFYEMQANYIVRTFVRGIAENIMGFTWYSIEGPGWRFTGLLDSQGLPLPVYTAYQAMVTRIQEANFTGTVNYGAGLDAFEFRRDNIRTHVVWAKANQSLVVQVPAAKFVAAYDRNGNAILPAPADASGNIAFTVGFNPVYFVLVP